MKGETPFSDAVKKAKLGKFRFQSTRSLGFYKQYTKKNLQHINSLQAVRNTKEVILTRKIEFGKIYAFKYVPKHKKTLPYYDSTPLIVPFKDEGDTFMAFNLHYIPIPYRAVLMDVLFQITQSYGGNKGVLHANYQVIMNLSKSDLFKPCIKRYIKANVRSYFLEFQQPHWELCVFLPISTFRKASESKVHADSMQSITSTKKRNR